MVTEAEEDSEGYLKGEGESTCCVGLDNKVALAAGVALACAQALRSSPNSTSRETNILKLEIS